MRFKFPVGGRRRDLIELPRCGSPFLEIVYELNCSILLDFSDASSYASIRESCDHIAMASSGLFYLGKPAKDDRL